MSRRKDREPRDPYQDEYRPERLLSYPPDMVVCGKTIRELAAAAGVDYDEARDGIPFPEDTAPDE